MGSTSAATSTTRDHVELVLFIGIQATGKSTFYRERFVETHLRLNMDMLRTRHRESVLLRALIEAKQPLVVDNTNPTREDRARYIQPARATHFRVVGYYFQSKLDEALARNAERAGKKRIPDVGVRNTYNRLALPTRDEGFDELRYVRLTDGRFSVEAWSEEQSEGSVDPRSEEQSEDNEVR